MEAIRHSNRGYRQDRLSQFAERQPPTTSKPFRIPFCILEVAYYRLRTYCESCLIVPPPVPLFCIPDRSSWHTRICVESKTWLFRWLLPGRFMRVFRFSQNFKAVSIAPARFLVLHSGFFFMVYKDLCRMGSLVFWGCSRMGLALVILFCTVNRSSL